MQAPDDDDDDGESEDDATTDAMDRATLPLQIFGGCDWGVVARPAFAGARDEIGTFGPPSPPPPRPRRRRAAGSGSRRRRIPRRGGR